jgi:hypothetical protein
MLPYGCLMNLHKLAKMRPEKTLLNRFNLFFHAEANIFSKFYSFYKLNHQMNSLLMAYEIKTVHILYMRRWFFWLPERQT